MTGEPDGPEFRPSAQVVALITFASSLSYDFVLPARTDAVRWPVLSPYHARRVANTGIMYATRRVFHPP